MGGVENLEKIVIEHSLLCLIIVSLIVILKLCQLTPLLACLIVYIIRCSFLVGASGSIKLSVDQHSKC